MCDYFSEWMRHHQLSSRLPDNCSNTGYQIGLVMHLSLTYLMKRNITVLQARHFLLLLNLERIYYIGFYIKDIKQCNSVINMILFLVLFSHKTQRNNTWEIHWDFQVHCIVFNLKNQTPVFIGNCFLFVCEFISLGLWIKSSPGK